MIDIGGNAPLEVVKKNPKTVVTGSGSKWRAEAIFNVIKSKPTVVESQSINLKKAENLRKKADGMEKKFREMTRDEQVRPKAFRRILYKLADAHENGTIPDVLKKISSVSDLELFEYKRVPTLQRTGPYPASLSEAEKAKQEKAIKAYARLGVTNDWQFNKVRHELERMGGTRV
jgi:hypothetical protein